MNLDTQLIRTNVWASVALLVTFLIGLRSNHVGITALGILFASVHMFFLSGANIMYLIQKIQKRAIDVPLFVTLSILSSLFLTPALLLGIYSLIGPINPWIPLTLYILITLIPLAWNKVLILYPTIQDTHIPAIPRPSTIQAVLTHPVTIGIILIAAVHAYNISRYPFLAVLDPYSWLIAFDKVTATGSLHSIDDGDRPLYTVLITSFHYLSTTSYYTITKYIFPFLSLLTIPPLYLAGKNLSKKFQYLFLAAALASPVVIFEFEIVRQQLMALIYMYFVVGLCAAYALKKDKTIMYIVGASAIIGSLYHPLFFMVIIPWMLCMGIIHWKFMLQHKIQALVALILLIPWVEKVNIHTIVNSIAFLGKRLVLRFMQGNQNWSFPAKYVNIDQNSVGWAGPSGVAKYYVFYMGTLSFVIIAMYIGSILLSPRFRTFVLQRIRTLAALIPLLLLSFFFLVAEIAPRLSNIAYLPDRAWQILSIILLFPLLGLLMYTDRVYDGKSIVRRGIYLVLSLAIAINIFGAGYVTYLGGFTVPTYEREAAAWIKGHLPKNRVIFSASSKNLLRFHTQSNRIHLEPEYFGTQDARLIVEHVVTLLHFQTNPNKPLNSLSITGKVSERIEKTNVTETTSTDTSYDNISICDPGYLAYIQQKVAIQCVVSSAPIQSNEKIVTQEFKIPKEYTASPIYLYYAKTDSRNPYNTRPYKSSFTGTRDTSEFPGIDSKPEIFEKVYSDNKNVFIWLVHLDKAGIPIE